MGFSMKNPFYFSSGGCYDTDHADQSFCIIFLSIFYCHLYRAFSADDNRRIFRSVLSAVFPERMLSAPSAVLFSIQQKADPSDFTPEPARLAEYLPAGILFLCDTAADELPLFSDDTLFSESRYGIG